PHRHRRLTARTVTIGCEADAELVGEEHGEEAVHETRRGRAVRRGAGSARAADDDARHDVHAGVLDRLREAGHDLLRELVLRSAVGADLLVDGNRLADADAGGLLGLRLGEQTDLLRARAGERLDARRLLHRTLVLRL